METEEETISLEDTLDSLKRNAYASQVLLQESLQKLKIFQKHVHQETSLSLSEQPLQPKTRMMKWLTDRQLAVQSTFLEFFEMFIDEHKQEHRLDVSNRTIQLNSKACILLGYDDHPEEPWVSVYDVITKAMALFE